MNDKLNEVINLIIGLAIPLAIYEANKRIAKELKEREFIEKVCIGGPL